MKQIKNWNKKGNLDALRVGVVTLVFIALLAAAGAIALTSFKSSLTANSAADNVTQGGLTGILNATSFLGTIGTLLGVAALVAVVIGAFYVMQK